MEASHPCDLWCPPLWALGHSLSPHTPPGRPARIPQGEEDPCWVQWGASKLWFLPGQSAAWPDATRPSREQGLLCSSHWERTLVPVRSLGSGRPDLCPPGLSLPPVSARAQESKPWTSGPLPEPLLPGLCQLCRHVVLPHPTPGCSGTPHGGPARLCPVPADHLPPPLVSLQYTSSMRAKYLATSQPRPNSSSSGH